MKSLNKINTNIYLYFEIQKYMFMKSQLLIVAKKFHRTNSALVGNADKFLMYENRD